jgi:hypothetical protein
MGQPNTPHSDAALEHHWSEFTSNVSRRLDAGRKVYGDTSFERPLERVVTEIQEELEDVCGWSFILWTRLQNLKQRLPKQEEVENAKPVRRHTANPS